MGFLELDLHYISGFFKLFFWGGLPVDVVESTWKGIVVLLLNLSVYLLLSYHLLRILYSVGGLDYNVEF